MTKKILISMLALLAIATTAVAQTKYGFWVAGVEVTSENYTKIVELSNGAIKQGTVEYKPDKKSLVLRNVIIDREYECLENVSCDGLMVTIYGKGNTFNSTGIAVKCQTNTTIQVPLQASATFRSKNATRVVYLNGGNLTIKGKGDLLVIGEKENGIEGKNATETLNIEDTQMTVEANGCSLYDLGEVVFSGTATTKLTFYGNGTSKRVLNVKKMTFNGDQNLSLPTDAYFDSQRQTVIAGPTITYSIPFTADDRENSIKANTGTPVTRKSVVINTDRVADVNETNFPNATFRAKVKKLCQYNENILTPFDVYCTRLIYFGQGVGISTNGVVKGLEHFIYLRQLHINRDALQSIDLSKNPELRDLAIEQCSKLTTLDLSTNTELTKLSCSDNELTTLDLSKNTKLIKLRCYGNQIKGDKMQVLVESLPTVGSGEFVVIDTKKTNEGNVITKAQVNIAKSKGWKVLDYNGMKEYAGSDIEINAGNFPDEKFRNFLLAQDYGKDAILTNAEIAAVTEINVLNKGISDLTGIHYFTNLKTLNCSENNLTSLDVSQNAELTTLYCSINQLSALDVSSNKQLTTLYCYYNQIGKNEMQTLVNSLPTVSDRQFRAINMDGINNGKEKNFITPAQVEAAKNKGWNVWGKCDVNGTFKWQEFAGAVAIAATPNNADYGTVTGAGTYEAGKTVTLTATPNKGYKFKQWTYVYKGKKYTDTANPFVLPNNTADRTLTASFEKDETTAINTVENGKMTNDNYYSIDGVKLSGEPTKKGVYVYKGKKVVKK